MYYVGVLLALGVALFGGLANVAVAVCGRGIDSSVLVFYCGLICIPVGLVASSFDPNQRIISRLIVNIPPQEWGELLLQSKTHKSSRERCMINCKHKHCDVTFLSLTVYIKGKVHHFIKVNDIFL